MNITTQQMRDF